MKHEEEIRIDELFENYPLSLMLSADPDIKKIEKCLNKGRCFVAFINNKAVGEYILQDLKNGDAEITNLAVHENFHRQGIGSFLLKDATYRAKNEGFSTLIVKTGRDTYQQRFYEKSGFSAYFIDEGYFTRNYSFPIMENGIQHIDQVSLKKVLTE